MPTLFVAQQLAKAMETTMVDLLRDVESNAPPGDEPPPLPRGRPRKKKRGRRTAPEAGEVTK